MKRLCSALAWVTLSFNTAFGAPPPPETVNQLVGDYFANRPSEALAKALTMEEAFQTQQDFVGKLSKKLGRRVGYKVGLVTREAQQQYGINSPVRGVLLARMLLKDGAEVPADFGVRPICEADLIVVVKDSRINNAKTPLEVAQHLKEVVVFIELPDAFLATNPPIDGARLTAANVAARLGVLGQRVPVKATPEFVDALAQMTVTMTDQSGAELGKGQGKMILGNPLNAVLWLVQDLNRSDEKLKAGDLLSLGAVKNIRPQAGQTVTVRYDGLPGGPIKASVRFR